MRLRGRGVNGAGMKCTDAPIQFWCDADGYMVRNPNREAIFRTLFFALTLLREAVPIALESIGSRGIDAQEEFWYAYMRFRTETDLGIENVKDQLDTLSENAHAVWRKAVQKEGDE